MVAGEALGQEIKKTVCLGVSAGPDPAPLRAAHAPLGSSCTPGNDGVME